MTNVLKPGDTVRLRSGGFPMTIEKIHGDIAICTWDDEHGERRSSACSICDLVNIDEELLTFG